MGQRSGTRDVKYVCVCMCAFVVLYGILYGYGMLFAPPPSPPPYAPAPSAGRVFTRTGFSLSADEPGIFSEVFLIVSCSDFRVLFSLRCLSVTHVCTQNKASRLN